MELFINIAISLLLVAIVIAFFRNPREIVWNFIKFILKFPIRIIPFGPMVYRAYKESREKEREKKSIEKLVAENQSALTIRVIPEDFEVYLIIFGSYPREIIEGDFQSSHRLNLQSHYLSKDDYTILSVQGFTNLKSIMLSIWSMAKLYGTANTYGFLKSESSAFFFHPSYDDPSYMVGKTDKSVTFFYSLGNAKEQKNNLILGYPGEINHKLSTGFFNELIQA